MAEKTNEEIESLIVDMAKKGITAEKIGLSLRDEHGFQKQKNKIKISEILRKHNLYISPDVSNLTKKTTELRDHIQKNKQDKKAIRDLVRLDANLKRQKRYLE